METLATTKWKIDTSHTEVQFKVKHLVFTTVTGKFREFHGELITDREDFDGARASFEINTASLDTNSPDRDGHLKSADFFAAEQFPLLTLKNGVLKKTNGNHFTLTGDLTIRETTKQVVFDVEHQGSLKDPWGNQKTAFEIVGKINRKDYGLVWNAIAEAGALLVAEEVKIEISAQLGL